MNFWIKMRSGGAWHLVARTVAGGLVETACGKEARPIEGASLDGSPYSGACIKCMRQFRPARSVGKVTAASKVLR